MFSTKSARLLIAAACVVILVVIGLSRLKQREAPSAAPTHSVQQAQPAQTKPSAQSAQPQPAPVPVPAESTRTQTSDAIPEKTAPDVEEPRGSSSISAFREWAETAATVGQDNADQNRGMELARARAIDMKALIKKDPAKALREALPADLRAALPPNIAAAIEQPVKPTGTVSLRMMCKHSSGTPHGNCESAPVLVEEIISWNAYYDEQKWRSHLGQTVQLEGIAVDEEVAVGSVTPVPVE